MFRRNLESLKVDFKTMKHYKDKVKTYPSRQEDDEPLRTIRGGTTLFGGSKVLDSQLGHKERPIRKLSKDERRLQAQVCSAI